MEALAGVGVIFYVVALVFGVYLFIMLLLLPHYVRQIRDELKLISGLLGGGSVTVKSFDGLTPEQIIGGEGDRLKKIRALADLRDAKQITPEQFEEYKAQL